jgi:ribosomal protein S18 acetylase RimI-like enzyme
MWVDPAWGTRGLGAELVREVLDWARSWGALWMVLAITESNDGAARFYERIGFVDTGLRHPLRDGSPLSVRVLRREPRGPDAGAGSRPVGALTYDAPRP